MALVVARNLVPVHRVTPNPDQVAREGDCQHLADRFGSPDEERPLAISGQWVKLQ